MGRFIVVVAALAACANEPTERERCEQVRDRVVELRLASASRVDRTAHAAAMKQALGDDFLASCQTSLSGGQRDCVLAARDAAAVTACTASSR